MKKINPRLHHELRRNNNHIVLGWKMTLVTGEEYGFTSGDAEFEFEGLVYEPTNAFSGMAAVSRANLSVDNTSAVTLITEKFNRFDLQAGKFDNATVRMFWIDPDHPEWGIVPLRGGTLGEIKITDEQFEAELRSPMQRLQQPFGEVYSLDCGAKLGDHRCKVTTRATIWAPATRYVAKAGADGGIGSYVRPFIDNGYWYQCISAKNNPTRLVNMNLAQMNTRNLGASGWGALFDKALELGGVRGAEAQWKLEQAQQEGSLIPDENSFLSIKQIFSRKNNFHFRNGVTIQGWAASDTAVGLVFYNMQQDANGNFPDMKPYYNPLAATGVPEGAPAGTAPLVLSNGAARVTFAIGLSGSTQPVWPTTEGAIFTDGDLVWKTIRARRLRGTVTGVQSRAEFMDRSRMQEPPNYWQYGVVTWLTGDNAGLSSEVRKFTPIANGHFLMLEKMPANIKQGDTYEVRVGCAGTRSACRAFDNMNNFRGFPDMPTEEKALAGADVRQASSSSKSDSGGS